MYALLRRATLFSGITVFSGLALAQSHAALTSHVPAAVAAGRAQRVGALPASQNMALAISLPLRNEAGLDALLERLYDPQDPNYHHYLSVAEFADQFGPSVDDHDALVHYSQAHGLAVTATRANRLVIDVEGPVANIESAFHVNLGVYQHPTESRTFYAPDREPTLDVQVPVLHISGLDNFSLPYPKRILNAAPDAASKTTGSGPNGQFIGSDMRAAYYGSGPLNGAGQSVGLFEYAGYELSDVQLYFQKVNQPLNVPVVGVSVNGRPLGCAPPKCDDSEQALDIEMTISMAPALSQVVVYVGSSDVSILSQMAADNTSKQLSCSWGWTDDETSIDPIFKEMIAQGQTFFVATGDNGSSTPADSIWPSDDPYVTAVGGTDLTTTGPGGAWASETGWSGSAGMPSKNNVPIPGYQKLAGVINSTNKGSKTLRNIPDVAAEANTNQYSCFDGGCYGGNGGTSYAAPQWAGFMAMVNQQSATNGGAPLGFINALIYKIGVGSAFTSDFHDIVSGSNGKYSAVTGFDLVTGWGSMIGPSLLDALLAAK